MQTVARILDTAARVLKVCKGITIIFNV